MSALALRGVSKHFDGIPVLENISLQIGANEFVVVLGPSGCGKSTLLRVIAGLETMDSGEIEIEGARIDRLPPGKRGVAMVFQTYALYPHMTIRENMAFGLRNIGIERAEIARRIADAAAMLEIEPLLDRRPAALSGGQRQRAAIGRAIVKEPKVFMFDEPLSNLDAALRARTRQEIAALHRRLKAAMIFVTHDQTEAMTLADRIVVMNARRIEQIGTPAEIYARPATDFVARFVGSPTMNILSVERVAADGKFQMVRLGNGTPVQTQIAADQVAGKGDLRIGLRPESLHFATLDRADATGIVEFREYLGDKIHAYVTLGNGDKVVITTEASAPVTIGKSIGLHIDGAAAHLFDSEGRGYHQEPVA